MTHRCGPWLLLTVTLLLCAPPLFIDLGGRLSTHTMENVALVTSQEAWLRWHEGDSQALLLTTNDFRPRFQKPPLLTWLNFIAWSDLDPKSAKPVVLTHRARLVSASLGLVMLASIFWIGCTVSKSVRAAALATLMAGSMIFLQRQARTASYDIHAAAWATLAIAAGLWAIVGRQWLQWGAGWLICGMAMGLSVLSKNPLSLAVIVLPLAGAIAVNPDRAAGARGGSRHRIIVNAIGLGCALLVSCLLFGPWYIYIVNEYDNATRLLEREFSQARHDPQPVWYYAGLLLLLLPWTPWVVGGLAQPFAARWRAQRRRLLIAWLWFAVVLVMFSCFDAKQQRYVLPIVPAAALLAAAFCRAQARAAEAGQNQQVARGLGTMLWIVVIIISAALGMVLARPDWVAAAPGGLRLEQLIQPVGWLSALLSAGVLAAIAVAGWRFHMQQRPLRAATALALWMLLMTTAFWPAYSDQSSHVQRYKLEAERIAAIVGEAPLRSLRVTSRDRHSWKLNEEFRFYYGKLIRHVTRDDLSDPNVKFVLAKSGDAYEKRLRKAGFEKIADVEVNSDDIEGLWRRVTGPS